MRVFLVFLFVSLVGSTAFASNGNKVFGPDSIRIIEVGYLTGLLVDVGPTYQKSERM